MITANGHNGQVTFDGTFVTITRSGFLARATVGKGEKRLPIGSITGVQWKPASAMVNGFIQFTVPGGNEVRSHVGSQTRSAGQDENSVIFMRKQSAEFEALRAAVEQAIATRQSPPPVYTPPPAPAPDIAGQLQQLATLRDQGILTPQEFEAKKAELLARM